eukprot:2404477-Ditylum_brightwellii.AAC.1
MSFHPNEPINTVFTEVDDPSDIVEIAKRPIMDKQKVDLAYLIIQWALKFKLALKQWNSKPKVDCTYATFRTYFCKAQCELYWTGDLTMEEGLNHTKLVKMVMEEVQ